LKTKSNIASKIITKKYNFIFFLLVALFVISGCSSEKEIKEHLKNARDFESAGDIQNANNEYIRAFRKMTNIKEKGDTALKIARNCREKKRFQQAEEHYIIAIDCYNKAKTEAPYDELADIYINMGQLNKAAALIKDVEVVKPLNYMLIQAKIAMIIASYYENKEKYEDAEYYYEEMIKYAKKAGNEDLGKEGEDRIEVIKELLNN
jgi:tetratricopeptide (TPR) repeat protein